MFLFGQRSQIPGRFRLSTLKLADEFIWLTEDTPTFIAGRVDAAIRRYREHLLPPMFAAMLAQANVREYAFGTPGHLGGTAFLKTPVSKVFFDYFGENLFRSDLSIGMARGRLAARSQRADRREREVRRARLRRASLLHRHERHVELEPHHLHGQPDARTTSRCATATATSPSSTA